MDKLALIALKKSGSTDVSAAVAAKVAAQAAQSAAETAQAAAEDAAEDAVEALASEYSTSSTYAVGDYCVKDGVLYRCTTAISTAESWTAAHWTAVKVTTELASDYSSLKSQKANIDGYYESMTVGNAEQLLATVGVEDKVPYNFRTAGGSADIGDRETDMVVGGTVAWNQLYPSNCSASAYGLTTNTVNGKLTISGETNSTGNREWVLFTTTHPNYKSIPSGHKVFVSAAPSPFRYRLPGATYTIVGKPAIFSVGANAFNQLVLSLNPMTSGDEYNLTAYPQIIDLTQMFGSTIADYIYSLEQTTAGAGVAWFRHLFPKDYYAYNPGELMSVQAASHITRGFNAWDEEWEEGFWNTNTGEKGDWAGHIRFKNYMPILPGTTYYKKCTTGSFSWHLYYDANKNYIGNTSVNPNSTFTTPNNAYYMTSYTETGYGSVYKDDLCINLSWDGERDGEYEEYTEHVYPLDSSLTLRGIPKLDASNKLYYDGDTYESDGTVTRRYGIVDLGTLTWTADSNRTGVFYAPITIKSNGAIFSTDYQWRNNRVPDASNIASYNKLISAYISYGTNKIYIVDHDFDSKTGSQVATALSGKYAVYELAESTTESADPYQATQIVDDFGTEEYVDAGVTAATPTRDVAIPVGHETTYQTNLRAKLEMAPDSPSDGDGDYIVRHVNGMNSYVPISFPADELPAAPTENGNYHLKCTVANGTATYTWEADT